jgi:hypothetical protein
VVRSIKGWIDQQPAGPSIPSAVDVDGRISRLTLIGNAVGSDNVSPAALEICPSFDLICPTSNAREASYAKKDDGIPERGVEMRSTIDAPRHLNMCTLLSSSVARVSHLWRIENMYLCTCVRCLDLPLWHAYINGG